MPSINFSHLRSASYVGLEVAADCFIRRVVTLLVDDRALLDAFRRGERGALATLYRHYARPVYSLLKNGFSFRSGDAWRRTQGARSEAEVEDLMQETFRRAFEERARLAYDGLRPYRSYLFMIARNLVLDLLRKRTPEFAADLTDDGSDPDFTEPEAKSPEEVATEGQLRGLVQQFRGDLSPEQQQFFDLRFVDEQEQKDVQAALGLSLYRIRTLERQLRKRMLAHLQKHGYLASAGAAA